LAFLAGGAVEEIDIGAFAVAPGGVGDLGAVGGDADELGGEFRFCEAARFGGDGAGVGIDGEFVDGDEAGADGGAMRPLEEAEGSRTWSLIMVRRSGCCMSFQSGVKRRRQRLALSRERTVKTTAWSST
jgi:hypothetical protein